MGSNQSNRLDRELLLLGHDGVKKLQASHILLAGCGGVGAYIAEALVRAGIGELTIYDPDKVHITNLNRQLPALRSNLDEYKVKVMQQRLLEIDPDLKIHAFASSLDAENIPLIFEKNTFDCVADAIDSINEKCLLLATAHRNNIPCISSMGAGFRLDPAAVSYADISKTHTCKLAKIVRSKLKKEYNITRGIECVFSSETPIVSAVDNPENLIGSSSYIPGIFGLFIAGRIIRMITGK